jgi:tRNA (cmo5U34)-methyltransferase
MIHPSYDASHAMAAVLLRDRVGEVGRILVIGAGGGIELSVFAREASGWSFTGVDPSVEMLSRARQKIDEAGATDRLSLVRGTAEHVGLRLDRDGLKVSPRASR